MDANQSGATPEPLKWYVVRAKPRRERFVHEQLSGQKLEVFYPAVRVNPVNPRSARERAYFPGYLFIRLDLAAEGASRIRWLPAVVGLVEFGGEPAIVPDPLFSQLQRRVDAIQAAGGLVLADLQRGDAVRIVSGPLQGYEAIFDLRLHGSDRVRVLIELLRRQVSLELDAGNLIKVKPGAAGKPARGRT